MCREEKMSAYVIICSQYFGGDFVYVRREKTYRGSRARTYRETFNVLIIDLRNKNLNRRRITLLRRHSDQHWNSPWFQFRVFQSLGFMTYVLIFNLFDKTSFAIWIETRSKVSKKIRLLFLKRPSSTSPKPCGFIWSSRSWNIFKDYIAQKTISEKITRYWKFKRKIHPALGCLRVMAN